MRGRSLDSKAQQVRPERFSARWRGRYWRGRWQARGTRLWESEVDLRGIRRKSRRSITRGAYNSRFNAQFGEGEGEGGGRGYLNTPLPGFSGRVSR